MMHGCYECEELRKKLARRDKEIERLKKEISCVKYDSKIKPTSCCWEGDSTHLEIMEEVVGSWKHANDNLRNKNKDQTTKFLKGFVRFERWIDKNVRPYLPKHMFEILLYEIQKIKDKLK